VRDVCLGSGREPAESGRGPGALPQMETQPHQNGKRSSILLSAAGGLLPDVDVPYGRAAQVLAILEGGSLGAALGWLVTGEILPAVAGGLTGAALGGAGILLLLGATVLAPLAWRVPVVAVLGGAGIVGCLLRSRTRRWSILSTALHVAGGHRGPTHSLLCLSLTTAVGLLLRATITWWALPRGVLAHLLLDTLTWGGVPWLWPWPKHFRTRWALHTGSWVENVVVFPLRLITAVAEGLAWLPGGLN